MTRLSVFLALAVATALDGQPPVVSSLDTVSIHVDSVETYNALLELWTKDFQWPLMYGKPLTAEQKDRRNYAGIWGGNVRLEICGPYPLEFQPRDSPARLHGLTFLPHETAEQSALALDRHEIRHRPTVTWGTPASPMKFVIFDDPAMIAPWFSISIMDVMKRSGRTTERDGLQRALLANRGGPLGLKRVREVQVGYTTAAALEKWQRLLQPRAGLWPGAGGPNLRFSRRATRGIAAAVLEVESLEQAARALVGLNMAVVRKPGRIECNLRGVRFVLTQ